MGRSLLNLTDRLTHTVADLVAEDHQGLTGVMGIELMRQDGIRSFEQPGHQLAYGCLRDRAGQFEQCSLCGTSTVRGLTDSVNGLSPLASLGDFLGVNKGVHSVPDAT